MTFPVKTLPVLQNWDCHATGSCCQEYRVTVSDEERTRILAQGWDPHELGGHPPFLQTGFPWRRTWELNHRPGGGCVFLSNEGRCRIHERFGYQAKPLPCRLFPFVLVPVGDHWRVGLRYACPSAAANRGRALPEFGPELDQFAQELALREQLPPQPGQLLNQPPPLDNGTRLAWPDLLRVIDTLLGVLKSRNDPFERRMRLCLALIRDLRKVKLASFQGSALSELLKHLVIGADLDTPRNPEQVSPPSWVGRLLFRQSAARYTRKDHGPNRGQAARHRLALFATALRFTHGRGPIPRLHRGLPEASFEEAELPRGPLPEAADLVLERYYLLKIGSLQFCGAASFGIPVWEGFDALALTLPILLWISRLSRETPREHSLTTAMTIVDDHFGFNRALGGVRQRWSTLILGWKEELPRLIAWYSR